MNADSLTALQMFQLHRRYLAPLFQRPYVCERDRQCEPLADNMQKVAECHLAARPVR